MRKKLLFFVLALPGWVLLGSYLYYDYQEYGIYFTEHILSVTPFYQFIFHFMISTTPIVSAVLAYFLVERGTLVSGLRAMERKYRDYYDNAPYGYHSADKQMGILEVNRTWLDMLGYESNEVVGRVKVTDLLAEHSRNRLVGMYDGFRKSGRLDDVELDFLRKDGSSLAVLLSATAVYEGEEFLRSRTIIKDNSERKTFEQILRSVAEHWEDTFNSMPWGVLILDSSCNVLRFNEYFLTEGKISPRDVAELYCSDLINEAEAAYEDEEDPEGREYSTEFYSQLVKRHFRVTGRMIYSGELTRNYVFSLLDITGIKRGEKKLMESRNAFFNMLKDASAAYNDLDHAYKSMIMSFANAIDAKSPWTKGHSERVRRYSAELGEAVGLDSKLLNNLQTAALLHDIGKIGTYDYVLEKPDDLTTDEYNMVKRHPVESARILAPIAMFENVVDIVKYHHEHYDGTGYPDGLKGEDIPYMSRILCLADSYDSMTADRPYRSAQSMQYAKDELGRCSGTHFDPALTAKFIELIDEGKV